MICISCSVELEPAFSDMPDRQPSGGLTFKGHGAYGSTVFDPWDSTYLEIHLCDQCLKHFAKRGLISLVKPVFAREPEPTVEPWNGQ